MTEQSQHPLDLSRNLCLKGDFEQSEAILEMLVDQGDPRAIFNMGWHHARKGELKKSMECLAVGRNLNVFGLPQVQTDKPIWKGQSLVGKRILFRGEGGYGDQFINLRFAKTFKDMGANVTVACPRDMFSLLRTVPYVDSLIDNEYAAGADHDYWVPAMSAPLVLGVEYKDLSGSAYLPAPKPIRLAGNLRVGIRWAGNPAFEDELHRKFPSELMMELCAGRPDISFYSLQRDDNLVEGMPDNVTDLQHVMRDWLATASIISGLDLVITSCTSIAHLSAAMGVPTWVVVPALPYYIWAEPGDKSRWYDSVTLFRQTTYGSWAEPFEAMKLRLSQNY